MSKSKIVFTTLLLWVILAPAAAEIKLPAIVSSNMVLQRNTSVVLWGWADPREKISVEASWLGELKSSTADDAGNWKIEVATNDSREPHTIRIKGEAQEILLENILLGEVWVCSGQSNMQQPLRGYQGQPTFGSTMAVAKSRNPNLRLFTVDRVGSKTPLKDFDKYSGWQESSPEIALDFSAVAYFFGSQLQEILRVPVGMIHTSWGGSSVQAWISKEVMENFQPVDLEEVDINQSTNHIPTALFNGMINPLIPYAIRGALWYQGESNRMEPDKYKDMFPAMVKDWRNRWGQGDFPFYYVQIAPYMYVDDNDVFQDYQNSAFIREVQLQCLDLIPNSGIAITMDIGDDYCIHPPKKKEVADRLLYNALNQTYGFATIDGQSPVYDSLWVADGGIVLTFDHAESGMFAYEDPEGFEIAGEDRVFYPAKASIVDRKNVLVKSDRVTKPVAVRYAWRNWIEGTLFDTNLLPASSFRTDDWEDATRFME
jgi:sialate O-acetylesterase